MNKLTKVKITALSAMLAVSSTVFAQVKIGTNPTTIEANSNLEVEGSTSGRKMKVDKTTGQVTIADGTQGSGKIFTSDANGNGSWQSTSLAGGKILDNVAQTFPNEVSTKLETNAPMVLTQSGNFLVSLRWWGTAQNNLNGATSAYIRLKRNGTIVDEIEYYVTGVTNDKPFSFTVNLVASNCATNDILTIEIKPSIPTGATTTWKTGTAGPNVIWMPSVVVSKI